MKIIYAENWKERMDRCEQINCDNEKRLNLFKMVLLVFLTLLLVLWSVSINLYEKDLLTKIFIMIAGFLIVNIIWNFSYKIIADVIDAIIISNGSKCPVFKQVADTGATLSYLIAEQNAKVKYDNGSVYIEYEKQTKKGPELVVFQMEGIKTSKDASIEEMVLDLQKIELVLPIFSYHSNNNKFKETTLKYNEITECKIYLDKFSNMDRYTDILNVCSDEKLKKVLIYYKEKYVDKEIEEEKSKFRDVSIENPYIGDLLVVLGKLIMDEKVISYETWRNNQKK